jgi:hypothetical protein
MCFVVTLKSVAGIALLLLATALPSLAQINVTVNYANMINGNGNPLLFGGSNEPNPVDQASFYPQANAVGVKFQRGSIHVDQVVPSNTSLSAFSTAMTGGKSGSYVTGSVADPSTWTWGPTTWATNAKAQGWKTMANMLQAPTWLTYDGTVTGIPKNWTVWQYIVKKIIAHEGSYLDYVELLNEPTYFMTLTGSSYSTLPAASKDYYYNGAVAARAASSSIIIGGCADASGVFDDVNAIIADTRNTSNLLQFVSFHSYSTNPASTSIATLATTLTNNGRSGLPIFLTEWNSSSETSTDMIGDTAANFVAWQLMELTGVTQLTGADYFSFLPNNEVLSPYEDCSACSNYPVAMYSGTNGVVTLLPQARAYQLLSTDLGLGTGTFHTFATVNPTVAEEGWTTSNQNVAAAVVNPNSTATTVNFTLEGINTSGCGFTVKEYLADTGSNTAVSPVATFTNQCITNQTMTLTGIPIPPYATMGIFISK